MAATYLVEQGADVQKANEHNYDITLKDFRYENEVRNKAVYQDHVMTSIMQIEDYAKLDMEFAQAKEKSMCLPVSKKSICGLCSQKKSQAFIMLLFVPRQKMCVRSRPVTMEADMCVQPGSKAYR